MVSTVPAHLARSRLREPQIRGFSRPSLVPTDVAAAQDALPEVGDAVLVQRILQGEELAFADLVGRYHRKAFWIAYHVVGTVEDARDVAQESFLRVFRGLASFDFSRNFYTWFYRIVLNLAIDALRKKRGSQAKAIEDLSELPSDGADDSALERQETRQLVWSVLEKMDAKFKSVLVLRDIHGLSSREIAPILKVTHATVRWRLHRGRQIFREHWDRLVKEAD